MTMDETDYSFNNISGENQGDRRQYRDGCHTVGIDAIINMNGLRRSLRSGALQDVRSAQLGKPGHNEDFIRKAVEFDADVLLVSQTVTQKNVHVQNLTELVELLEAEHLRKRSF
jgi:beta-lysine 5,6-aminomutase beta subunit